MLIKASSQWMLESLCHIILTSLSFCFWHLLIVFFQFESFLILDMISHFFTETWVLYYSMKFSVLFKLSLLADVLWYHLSRGRENAALLLAGGNRSPGSLLGLHWLPLPQEGGAAHYCWVGVEILAPHWTLTDISLTGRGGSGLLWLPTWLVAMLWQRMVLLLLDGGESPDSLPSLLLHHLHKEGEGCLVTTRWW